MAEENMNGSMPEGAEVWASYSKYKDILNQAAKDTEGFEGQLKVLSPLISAASPEVAGFIEAASRFGPLGAATAAAALGIDQIFKRIQTMQDQFNSLVEEGQKVNDMVKNLIASRPTATQTWLMQVDQLARLNEQPSTAAFVGKQLIASIKESDEAGVKNAPDSQKPEREREVITDEIANTRGVLQQALSQDQNLGAAQVKVDQANASENDLANQITSLPEIIATARKKAAESKKAGDEALWPSFKEKDYQLANDENGEANRLQAQLDKATTDFPAAAKAAAGAENDFNNIRQNLDTINELRQQIIVLNNKLGVFDNSQEGQKLKDQIQKIITTNDGTGQSIQEMGDKLHYSQQQLTDLAARIIKQQTTTQATIDSLHAQLDTQARQIAAMPNSNR